MTMGIQIEQHFNQLIHTTPSTTASSSYKRSCQSDEAATLAVKRNYNSEYGNIFNFLVSRWTYSKITDIIVFYISFKLKPSSIIPLTHSSQFITSIILLYAMVWRKELGSRCFNPPVIKFRNFGITQLSYEKILQMGHEIDKTCFDWSSNGY